MRFPIRRREALVSLATTAISAPVFAQASYPSRPIRLIVGFPAGGFNDVIYRTVAAEATKILGQPIVIDNRPGAGGVIAYLAMKAAAPNGYTIGFVNSTLWRQPVLEDVAYDPLQDFTYIINFAESLFAIAVADDSPFKTWADLLSFGRANPQKVSFGVPPGVRGSSHLLMAPVLKRENVAWQPIGYPAGSGLTDLMRGDLTFSVEPIALAGSLARAGRLRFLAVASDQRLQRWPGVPTMKELGYPDTVDLPVGLGGPAGIPAEIVQVLHNAFKTALEQPSMTTLLEQTDQVRRYMGPSEFKAFVLRTEAEQRALLIRYGFANKR